MSQGPSGSYSESLAHRETAFGQAALHSAATDAV